MVWQPAQDSVDMSALPLIVVQWKQLAVVVSLFSGATIGIIVAIYRGWRVVSQVFEKSVQMHAVPLMTVFKNEVTAAMGGLKNEIATLNRNLEHLQISDARRAEDMAGSGKRLDCLEDQVHGHDLHLTELRTRFDSLEKFTGPTGRHHGGRDG